MRLDWNLPSDGALGIGSWTITDVLLEFNGPQMVLIDDHGRRYLAVAADDEPDSNTERWVRAPVTATEEDALREGAIGPYDVLNKASLQVVDLDPRTQQPKCLWTIERAALTEEHLPLPGARLPDSGVHTERSQAAPVLRLDGGAVAGSTIHFEALSDVLKHFQRLWAALAQAASGQPIPKGKQAKELRERAALNACALQPGSVCVHVQPTDPELFAKIGELYSSLVAARHDDDQLLSLLHQLKHRAGAAYRSYLMSLEKHDLQLYATWNDSRVFVGPDIARDVRPRLLALQEAGRTELEAQGTFEAFNIPSSTFTFRNDTTEETYSGEVAPDFSVEEREIGIGPAALYEVRLSVLLLEDPLTGPKSRFQLLSARRLPAATVSGSTDA